MKATSAAMRLVTARQSDRRARALVPPSGEVSDLLINASAATRRAILVSKHVLPSDGPSGIWLATESADVVVIDAESSAVRQEAALCHELGHIVLGHVGTSPTHPTMMATAYPDLSPDLVARARMMHRCGLQDADERAAERFGTVLVGALRAVRAASARGGFDANRFR